MKSCHLPFHKMSFQDHLAKKDSDFSVISDSASERESDGTRRKLYDDESESIKVFLRIRNYTEEEAKRKLPTINLRPENSETLVVYPPDQGSSRGGNSHKFKFSRIYEPSAGQQILYDSALSDVVKEFLDGANFLVFNYGVTNAGKTFTMQGTPQQPGLIPRSLDTIFSLLRGKISSKIRVKPHSGGAIKLGPVDVSAELRFKEDVLNRDCDNTAAAIVMDTLNASAIQREMSLNFSAASSVSSEACSTKASSLSSFNFTQDSLNTDNEISYSIWVSFAEVYNELIYDLLESIKNGKRTSLKLCERGNGNVFIKGAKEVCVFSAEEAYRVLLAGQKNLRYAATKLNHNSSRSHCLFTVKLLAFRESGSATITQLSFCDLAGSERAANTLSQGERLREAGLINTSLLVLGRCFETLRANQKLGKESRLPVPFRESKLTRILQNNFSGKARALMIVNISPCANMYNETFHVLKFSAIASEVVLSQTHDVLLEDLRHTKFSLALLRRSLADRESLPWESSNVEEESRGHASHRSSTIFENEEEEWETDEEEGEIDFKKKTYELLELAQKLSGRLYKERADKLQMEIDIREELTEEFQARMDQLQDFYRDQIDEVYEDAEDMADKRIEIYDEFYRSAKRCRCRSDEPRASGTADETCSEKDSSIAELESEVRVLQKECETLKEGLHKAVQSEVSKQEQLTALHFQMAEVRREANCHTYEKRIEELQQELTSTKASLESWTNAVSEMRSAVATQAETLDKRSKEVAKDFEETRRALLFLCKVGPESGVDAPSSVPDDDEARRRQLNRRTIYYSMSSSSAPSSSETPKSTQAESHNADKTASSGDEICQPFAVSLTLSESPEMPALLPMVLAANVPDEVFEAVDRPCSVSSRPGTPGAEVAKEAAVLIDTATSPISSAMENSEREMLLLRRIKELEEIIGNGKVLERLKEERRDPAELVTPTHQKEDIENRVPRTEKRKTSKKDKVSRSATRGPVPQDDSSIDEMTSAALLKKKGKVPLPKKTLGADRFLCSPVKDPSTVVSPNIQAQVMRKLRHRK